MIYLAVNLRDADLLIFALVSVLIRKGVYLSVKVFIFSHGDYRPFTLAVSGFIYILYDIAPIVNTK